MNGLLEAMGAVGGAIALIDRLTENPKGRERTLDSLRLDLIYANADAVSNDWMKRDDGRKRAEKALAAIKRKIATLRRAGKWDERLTDYYLGKKSSDEVSENPTMRKKNPIESGSIEYDFGPDYKGRRFGAPFKVYREPSQAPGWFVFGTSPEGVIRIVARPAVEARKHPHYNIRVRRGFSKKSEADQIAKELNARTVANNPRGRSKRSIHRPSQITGKTPTKRLVARRAKSLKAPKGFYANPVPLNFIVTELDGTVIASFATRPAALQFASAFATKNKRKVRLVINE